MMKILILLIVLLALIGGGAFGVSIFAPTLLPPPVAAIMGVELPEVDEDVKPEVPIENTALIDVEPITIPLFTDNNVDRFLIIHVFLVVETGPNVAFVNQQMTRIVDAIITHTHALAALDVDPGIEDRAFLKERLLEKIGESIGEGYVIDILFQNLFERPLG